MCQMTKTIAYINTKFRERAMLVPQYVANEEMNKARYHDMLWDDIREFASMYSCMNLEDMIARAW